MRRIFVERRSEFWVALATALTVLFIGVELGILLAIALSLVDHTRPGYRPGNAVLVPAGTGAWRPRPVATHAQALPGLLVYRFTHSMYYANAQQLSDEITGLVASASPPLEWLCIDMSAVDDIEYTAAETLRSLHALLARKGIHLVVAHVLEDALSGSQDGSGEAFDGASFHESLDPVAAAYRQRLGVRRSTGLEADADR